jgi:hypothetical protein
MAERRRSACEGMIFGGGTVSPLPLLLKQWKMQIRRYAT